MICDRFKKIYGKSRNMQYIPMREITTYAANDDIYGNKMKCNLTFSGGLDMIVNDYEIQEKLAQFIQPIGTK